MDPVGWQSGPFAEYLHDVMLDHIAKGTTSRLFFEPYVCEKTRFSISNFCFFGMRMTEIMPQIDDEEIWLAERIPEMTGIPNVICGDALVSHYSFFSQRPHLDTTDILHRYQKEGERLLSERYYELLGQAQ